MGILRCKLCDKIVIVHCLPPNGVCYPTMQFYSFLRERQRARQSCDMLLYLCL